MRLAASNHRGRGFVICQPRERGPIGVTMVRLQQFTYRLLIIDFIA
jgi:hypothetical protein